MYRPDVADQYRYERKHLETGGQSERFRRYAPRRSQRSGDLHLPYFCRNSEAGTDSPERKDRFSGRRFPFITNLHGDKDSGNSDGREAKLKVILETGALVTPENIRKAAILALYSGADFIKTSTGKGYPGATPEAVYTMCKVLKKYHSITGNKAGIKISGGVRTAEDAVKYYTIVKEVLGNDWLNNELFRIGASSLVEDIEHRLGK